MAEKTEAPVLLELAFCGEDLRSAFKLGFGLRLGLGRLLLAPELHGRDLSRALERGLDLRLLLDFDLGNDFDFRFGGRHRLGAFHNGLRWDFRRGRRRGCIPAFKVRPC